MQNWWTNVLLLFPVFIHSFSHSLIHLFIYSACICFTESFPGGRKTGDKTARHVLGNSEESGVTGAQQGVAVEGMINTRHKAPHTLVLRNFNFILKAVGSYWSDRAHWLIIGRRQGRSEARGFGFQILSWKVLFVCKRKKEGRSCLQDVVVKWRKVQGKMFEPRWWRQSRSLLLFDHSVRFSFQRNNTGPDASVHLQVAWLLPGLSLCHLFCAHTSTFQNSFLCALQHLKSFLPSLEVLLQGTSTSSSNYFLVFICCL